MHTNPPDTEPAGLLWVRCSPLIEVAQCDAHSKDDYNPHHDDSKDISWKTKGEEENG